MNRIKTLCAVALLYFGTLFATAQEVNIDGYLIACEDITLSHLNDRTFSPPMEVMTYYLGYKDTIKNEYVWLDADSLWISYHDSTVMGISDPSKHTIDILSLERGQYRLNATYGDCSFANVLYKRLKPTTPEAIENTRHDSDSASKILRDGHLYIQRGGKTYNSNGALVGQFVVQ